MDGELALLFNLCAELLWGKAIRLTSDNIQGCRCLQAEPLCALQSGVLGQLLTG